MTDARRCSSLEIDGRRLALRRGSVLDHSGHLLVLSASNPTTGSRGPAVHTSPQATVAEAFPLVSRLFWGQDSGGPAHAGLAERFDLAPRSGQRSFELAKSAVEALQLTHDGDDASICAAFCD